MYWDFNIFMLLLPKNSTMAFYMLWPRLHVWPKHVQNLGSNCRRASWRCCCPFFRSMFSFLPRQHKVCFVLNGRGMIVAPSCLWCVIVSRQRPFRVKLRDNSESRPRESRTTTAFDVFVRWLAGRLSAHPFTFSSFQNSAARVSVLFAIFFGGRCVTRHILVFHAHVAVFDFFSPCT